jgi:GT2 family glycosyltransferase
LSNTEDIVPVIILNWNGEDDTIACLKSIRASEYAGFVPVLVDNGSEHESLEALERACRALFGAVLCLDGAALAATKASCAAEIAQFLREDSLILIKNGENLGFARGNNVGVRLAELAGAQWVMFLNNDTVVEPLVFREMRAFMRSHPSFHVATAQVRHFDQPTRIQNCGGDLTYFGSRTYRFADQDASVLPKATFSSITFATGCALLLRFKAVGTLTEKFFFGEEDYELALRMRRLGLPMACVHGAIVHHKGGMSIRRSSRAAGAILIHYVSRLIDLRNYYSKPRWHVTRMLAYLYLPFLLSKHGIDPRQTVAFVRRVESYVRRNSGVSHADFLEMIATGVRG